MSDAAQRPCEECGEPFTPANLARKSAPRYCSRPCFQAARARERAARRDAARRPCEECGETFTPSNLTNPGRFCSNRCFQETRTRRLTEQREARLRDEQEKREQSQREHEAKREQRDQDRRAEVRNRALNGIATTSPPKSLSKEPKLRIEKPAASWELERQSDTVFAAAELASWIETHRQQTGATIEHLSTRLDASCARYNSKDSGARTLYRIRSGESELVDLTTADAVALAAGTSLAMTGWTALATGITAARAMTRIRAELDEETISDADLERRARKLVRFSFGYLAAVQDVDVTPEAVEMQERREEAA